MRFLIHGAVHADAAAALVKHEHACHSLAELAGDAPETAAGDPQLLLELLAKKQWHLVTTDTALVRDVYERRLAYSGIIVLMLEDAQAEAGAGKAGGAGANEIDRLFERYKRLTPGRLYTITPSRVKIRQLPGGHN